VNVTQVDIDKALRNHSARCVVATAIKRAVSTAKRIEVDLQTIRWSTDTERVVFVTPVPVMDYITDFDAGDEIKPFSFRLNGERKATIPSVQRNQAAKQVQAAKSAVRAAEARKKKVASRPQASPAEKKVAAEKAAAASKKLVEVKQTVGPQAKTTQKKGEATHSRIPLHRKTGNREYGRKALRINQDREKLEQAQRVAKRATKRAAAAKAQ
jgi:hypothetical protein